MRRFVYKQEYVRPEATRVSDGVVVRLRHYEVDPELMGQHFDQQDMPAGHAADRRGSERPSELDARALRRRDALVAGQEPELDLGPGQPSGEAYPATPEVPARHPRPILPY